MRMSRRAKRSSGRNGANTGRLANGGKPCIRKSGPATQLSAGSGPFPTVTPAGAHSAAAAGYWQSGPALV